MSACKVLVLPPPLLPLLLVQHSPLARAEEHRNRQATADGARSPSPSLPLQSLAALASEQLAGKSEDCLPKQTLLAHACEREGLQQRIHRRRGNPPRDLISRVAAKLA